MTDHTPEPWTAESQPRLSIIHGPNGEHIADTGCWRDDEHPEMRANAARIVACVNACAGIPTEQLESGSVAQLIGAAKHAERVEREALPKLNWGASVLDANAIDLLNRMPGIVRAALAPFRKD